MNEKIDFYNVAQVIEEVFLQEYEREFETYLRNRNDIIRIKERTANTWRFEEVLCRLTKISKKGELKGYCVSCQSDQFFKINSSNGLREELRCSVCGFRSRTRYMIDRVQRSVPESKSKEIQIYLMEQSSNLYRYFKNLYPCLVGSEYLGDDKTSGTIYDGILHEDALKLSFDDECFDIVISCDVFEHVADCMKAFSETYRVLKKGGKLIFSVPIYWDRDITVVRAEYEKNELKKLLDPVYHGNPIDPERGSLVFYDYGIDILEYLKKAGFSDAYFVAYSSISKCYLGYLPLIIEAVK